MSGFSRIAVRNSAVGIGAQMVIKVLSFIFSIMILRRLGADQYGQYTAVLAFGGVFVFISDLGLSIYTVREIARLRDLIDGKAQIARLFQEVLQLRFLLALFTALLIIGSAWLTGRPLEMIIGVALGTLGLLMYSVQGSTEALLAGHERLDIAAGGRILHQLTFVLVGSTVLLAGMNYLGLIFANLAGIVLMTLICWRGVRTLGFQNNTTHWQRIEPKLWLKLIRFSIPFGIISFTLGLSYKFDSILLNVYHGDSATGYYNAAYTLVFSSVMLSNSINSALYPSLARQASTDAAALPAIYQRTLRYLLALSLPITFGTWLLADQIVPFMFGADYAPTIPVLHIIIWVLPLMYASEFLGYVVLIAGQETKVARAVIISTSVNILANLLLIPFFGLYGAAIMTVVTEGVLVLQYIWLLRQHLPFTQWSSALLRPLAAATVMGVITLVLREHTHLGVTIVLSALSYILALFVFGVVGRDEMRFVRQLQQQIQQRVAVRPSES